MATEASPDSTALVPSKNTAVAVTMYDRIVDPLDAINKIGITLFDSKMFGCTNIAQGRALALGFLANKLDPFSWKARHHIVSGNITMSAEAMLADFRTAGGEHSIVARTPDRAAVELRHQKKKQLFEFTWADAQSEDYVWNKEAAGDHRKRYLPNGQLNSANLKDNWKTPRRRMQMLWARVIADGVGAMMPEVSSGRQTPEELGVIMVEGQAEPLADPADDDVQDAEFSVTPENNNAASDEPASDAAVVSESHAAPVTDATVSPDGAAAPTPLPSLVESPPSGPASLSPADLAKANRDSLLHELAGLKKELEIPADRWQEILAKYRVTTARDLPAEILSDLIYRMQSKLDARRVKAGTDPVSQWANAVVAGKTMAEHAAEGN